MDYKTGERLTKYRKKNGYSQEALADKLGVSRQAISKWETGESAPDTDNLIALAKLYDVKIDDLLNVDPEDLNNNENKEKRRDKVISNNTQKRTICVALRMNPNAACWVGSHSHSIGGLYNALRDT